MFHVPDPAGVQETTEAEVSEGVVAVFNSKDLDEDLSCCFRHVCAVSFEVRCVLEFNLGEDTPLFAHLLDEEEGEVMDPELTPGIGGLLVGQFEFPVGITTDVNEIGKLARCFFILGLDQFDLGLESFHFALEVTDGICKGSHRGEKKNCSDQHKAPFFGHDPSSI